MQSNMRERVRLRHKTKDIKESVAMTKDFPLPFSTSSFEQGFLPEISQVISYISLSFSLTEDVRDSINSANLFRYLHSYRFRKFMMSKSFGNNYFHYINSFVHRESNDLLSYLKLFFIMSFKEILREDVSFISVESNNWRLIQTCSGVLQFQRVQDRLSVVPYACQMPSYTFINLIDKSYVKDHETLLKELKDSDYVTISVSKGGESENL